MQPDSLFDSPNEANCWMLSVASATPTADPAGQPDRLHPVRLAAGCQGMPRSSRWTITGRGRLITLNRGLAPCG